MAPVIDIDFWRELGPDDAEFLREIQIQAQQTPPAHWVALQLHGQTLGFVNPQRAQWIAGQLEDCRVESGALDWAPQDEAGNPVSLEQRNERLTHLLEHAHRCGRLTGWRNERFSFWDADCIAPRLDEPPVLEVERAGFRFLGMPSHAAHINGFTSDGRIWCGQRALDKATDPGLWDNLAAGGIPAGESAAQCAVRELAEEAGIHLLPPQQLHYAGWVRVRERSADDWHDEILHTFNLRLEATQVPRNTDGEVAQFQCFTVSDWMRRVRAGHCTTDSILTLLQAGNCSG